MELMAAALPNFPLADADKCVKCALCLPHCPTYKVSKDEGESPRGRIALMQAMATGALDITPRLEAHLDHCLGCRACEAVCPAEVPYGKLIDAARLELRKQGHQEPWISRHFASHMRRRPRRRLLHQSLRLAQRTGLANLVAKLGPSFLKRLVALSPAVPAPKDWQGHYASRAASGQKVSLFLGCVADVTQPEVTAASIAVLNAMGIEVEVPSDQQCCGALDQHAGRAEQASALARENLAAFAGEAPVLSSASGCAATLKEYGQLAGEPGTAFAGRVEDVSGFVLKQERLKAIQFQPWKARALVQTPCTLRNVMKGDKAVMDVLKFIPDLKVGVLPASLGCCGAAGSYMLTQAEQADAFADAYAAYIQEQKTEVLFTSNVGCSLHLRAALQRRGIRIPVLHPIEALALQLPDSMYKPDMDFSKRFK